MNSDAGSQGGGWWQGCGAAYHSDVTARAAERSRLAGPLASTASARFDSTPRISSSFG